MRKTFTAAALLVATVGGIAAGSGAAGAEPGVDTEQIGVAAPAAHDRLVDGDEEGFPNGLLEGLLHHFYEHFDAEDLIGG
jgi:hypothetical protein